MGGRNRQVTHKIKKDLGLGIVSRRLGSNPLFVLVCWENGARFVELDSHLATAGYQPGGKTIGS